MLRSEAMSEMHTKYSDLNAVHYLHAKAIKADDVADDGEFSGHAAIFGNVDQGGDMIIEGAFAETLRAHEHTVRVLFNHNSNEPIGRPLEMKEDKIGLFVRGKLNQDVQRGREVRALAKAGDIDGLSIGFRIRKGGAEFDEDTGVFKLLSVILREFSFATFPMNESAILTSMKSERTGITTASQFEQFLCDTTSFTKAQAQSIAACGFKESGLRLDTDAALTKLHNINLTLGVFDRVILRG